MSNISKSKQGYKKIKWLFGKEIEIPEEWELKRLKEVAKVKGGKRLPFGASFSEIKTTHPYLRVVDFKNNIIDEKNLKYISDEIFEEIKNYTVSSDNVYISIAGTIGLSGLIPNHLNGSNLTENAAKIIITENIIKNYLSILLNFELIQNQIRSYLGITSQPKLALFRIEKLELLLPSVNEQQKIASILSGVDALIESTQKTIEKTERLKKGLMQQLLARGINHKKFKSVKWLFGKEIQIPEEWEMSTIEGISKKLVSGGTPSTTILEYWNGDIPWTRSSILLDPYLKSGEKFITSEGLKNSSSVLIPKNNLLVSSRVSVGNISINAIDIAISQDVTGIIINKSYAQLEFLYWYLKQYIKKLVLISQGTTIKGFTRKELANLLIFLPSLSEQQKIASILSGVDAYIQKNQQYKERLEKLKKGLMQKLLTGQIRVKV